MTEDFYEAQIRRLEDQWRAAYGEERKKILWRCFKNVQDEEFQEAVSECLATQRSFPLLKELNEAVQLARTRSAERRQQASADRMLTAATLAQLADETAKDSTREFAKACLKLTQDRAQYTAEQWAQAMDLLEQTAASVAGKCGRCMDGWTTVEKVPGYAELYRCNCSVGRSLPPELVGVKNGESWIDKVPLVPFENRAAGQVRPDRPQEKT